MKVVRIGGRMVGEGKPAFIVAEIGSNHNGSMRIAKKLIDVAAEAGADAVKIQSFKTELLVSKNTPKAEYQKKSTGARGTQYAMLKKLELSKRQHIELMRYAKKRGLIFISTPFDEESVELLASLKVPAFKVGSGDTNNIPLLEKIASFKKPIILSTGMSTMQDIAEAIKAIKARGAEVILMHCTSSYPTRIEDANLKIIETLKKRFRVPVGYSDHTIGATASLAAVALGACTVEKHITLSKKMPGPDHFMCLEPQELKQLVKGIREVEKSLGSSSKKVLQSERNLVRVARKSVVAKTFIPKGAIITGEMVCVKRPGTGLPPKYLNKVVGKRARKSIRIDEVVNKKDIEW